MKTKKNYLKKLGVLAFAFSALILLTGCPADKDEEDELLLSSSKQIKAFNIVTPSSVGVINESAKTIAVDVPAGTNVTTLRTDIEISDKASVNPGSGAAANFTNPVQYSVTAEDGSRAVYTVTVNVAGGNDGPPTDKAQEIKNPISENLILKDLGLAIDYIVTNNVEVNNNAILTIEPGVCIAFERTSGYLTVRAGATVKMNGTASKPIQFRGSGATSGTEKGSWGYIDISTNSDNILEYVEFINGGSSTSNGALRITGSGTASISNCKITGSLGQGINASASATIKKFQNNTVTGCEKEPVYLGHISQVADFDITSKLTGNTTDYVSLYYGTLSNVDLTINRTTVPYYISSGIAIEKALTINEGVVFQMGPNGRLSIDRTGSVKMLGTASNPIKFTPYGNNTEPGSWGQISINTNNDNRLEYVEIYYSSGSSSNGSIYISDGTASIKNCTIVGSEGYGIYVRYDSKIKSFTGNKITKCKKSPVYLGHIEQSGVFDKTSDLTGNTDDYITINYGGVSDGNLTTNETTVPYYLSGYIEVDKTWTINDAEIYLHANASLSTVKTGRIVAQNATFTRLPDMSYYWPSIKLYSDNGSSFTNCTFEYGGKENNYGIITISSNAEITLNNCTIKKTTQYGIRIQYAGYKVKSTNLKFSDCAKGNVLYVPTGAVLTTL